MRVSSFIRSLAATFFLIIVWRVGSFLSDGPHPYHLPSLSLPRRLAWPWGTAHSMPQQHGYLSYLWQWSGGGEWRDAALTTMMNAMTTAPTTAMTTMTTDDGCAVAGIGGIMEAKGSPRGSSFIHNHVGFSTKKSTKK